MSDEAAPRRFTAKLKQEAFILETEDGDKEYTVRELVGRARDKLLTKQVLRYKIGADGKPSGAIKDLDGYQADLLCQSVYDERGTPVPINVIHNWPSSLQSELFKIAQKLSGLGNQEEAEVEAKND